MTSDTLFPIFADALNLVPTASAKEVEDALRALYPHHDAMTLYELMCTYASLNLEKYTLCCIRHGLNLYDCKPLGPEAPKEDPQVQLGLVTAGLFALKDSLEQSDRTVYLYDPTPDQVIQLTLGEQ